MKTRFLTIREIKKIARVNNTFVTVVNERKSSNQTFCNIQEKSISYNYQQINNIKESLMNKRKFNKQHLQLQVLLHELAHLKQSLKFKNHIEAGNFYVKNTIYCENLADRYSQIYYKKYLSFLEKTA